MVLWPTAPLHHKQPCQVQRQCEYLLGQPWILILFFRCCLQQVFPWLLLFDNYLPKGWNQTVSWVLIGWTLLLIRGWSNYRGPMVDRSFLFINFRSICTLSGAQTFWDTLYIQFKVVLRLCVTHSQCVSLIPPGAPLKLSLLHSIVKRQCVSLAPSKAQWRYLSCTP